MSIASDDVRILCAKGQPALSDIKAGQLLSGIRSRVNLPLLGLVAHHCYFLQHSKSVDLKSQLPAILDTINGERVAPSQFFDANVILVVPRLGTTSPWSTKATNILHRCGYDAVVRIERGTVWQIQCDLTLDESHKRALDVYLHDRMTESRLNSEAQIDTLFSLQDVKGTPIIDVISDGIDALKDANQRLGLALSETELEYLNNWCEAEKRNPTESEIMTFSQVNSEHCRHKIFNANWKFDGVAQAQSMFSMIRETHRHNPDGTLVAYEDNSAVICGRTSELLKPDGDTRRYTYSELEPAHIIFKAETHNHPTAISPFPGAATGAGGEIRDEGATGIGGKPKAGVCGFSVSHLQIPGYMQPWEMPKQHPNRIAPALDIMLEGPIGAASFNNEFGRPNVAGYFRTFETNTDDPRVFFGFHKPIMFAGGIGNIRPNHVDKRTLKDGDVLIVIGGPSMLIGLGGGAASSLGQGHSDEALDFASVQRSNPEMQRRCQETIDRCRELGELNPILSIHDVGAGGLSNALPEIVHAAGCGANIRLDDIPVADAGMSPMEIWCNEAQERYVLAIEKSQLASFAKICARENCPWQAIGEVTTGDRFTVHSETGRPPAVDVNLDFLLGEIPQKIKTDRPLSKAIVAPCAIKWRFEDCAERTLRYPSVADKSFLITIGDRTVSGLIHRDQMVGPWQIPVADAAVTVSGYRSNCGEAMAIGERSPIAVLDAAASARMALGEALTNLRSTGVGSLSQVRLCANWMAAAGVAGEASDLYQSVQSVALDLCLALGISIPVGKDSLSMSTDWVAGDGNRYRVFSPVSLVASAFAPLDDVRISKTPQLQPNDDTVLLLIDLGNGQNRMGMSVLHQTCQVVDGPVPDIDDVGALKGFFDAIGELIKEGQVLAYHDRSDGGLFATLCEMSFAGKVGLNIEIQQAVDPIAFFFNEELGAVIQVEKRHIAAVLDRFERFGLASAVVELGTASQGDEVHIEVSGERVFHSTRTRLHRLWSELTYKMQALRDNPDTAQQEYDRILDVQDPGLSFDSKFWEHGSVAAQQHLAQSDGFTVCEGRRPKVAILREQGVNGHFEMAAAFDRAGFEAVDVVMVDLISSNKSLDEFSGLALGGGFSFGDVFGAGRGWASLILQQNRLRDLFEAYFADTSKFVLGVCNGCQVLSELKDIIPGAQNWPKFVRNQSEQFEARLVMTQVSASGSIFTQGMHGQAWPVAVAHGEGRAAFQNETELDRLANNREVAFRYVDHRNQETDRYPFNPNGSQGAVAGVANFDGRITALMPHPERVFRMIQYSWAPDFAKDDSPWQMLFRNARQWVT